jgi:DNA polymerase-3 subunit beta
MDRLYWQGYWDIVKSLLVVFVWRKLSVKIICKQQDLNRGLSTVGHAVSSRSTLPILANILLTTENGRLKLSATNLEIGINCWVDAEIQEDGGTTIPAKLITDLVNSLPPADVEISVKDDAHVAGIKSQRSSATIKGMDPSEFPLIPSAEGSELPIVLDAAQLKEAIQEVAFAAADDDSRPVLTGVYVEVGNEKLTFAAADAFRLAVRVIDLPGQDQSQETILIPARTLEELARILPAEGHVEMIVTPNRSQVLFHTEQVDLVSRLIEGTFPNFRGIIPKEHTTRAVIETKEFAAAVKSVTPFARDSSNITRVKIAGGEGSDEGSLTLEATAEDVGSNVSTINATVDGPEQQIIFNVKYLTDILNVISAPEVALEVTSAARPGVIKPVSQADYTYVIMPMSSNR